MTIACTRCGATEDGDIILPALAFGFKHNLGCGHGVGPLAVLPGSAKKKPEKKPDTSIVDSVKEVFKNKEEPKVEEETKVEETVEETKPKKSKKLSFSQKD